MHQDNAEAARARLQAMIEAVTDEGERAALVAHLARYDADALALMRSGAVRRGSSGRPDRASVATHHGDGRNMRQGSQGGCVSNVWLGWNGNWNPSSLRRQRVEGHLEPVFAGVSAMQAGKYGTQTPPDRRHIARVMPGLA